MSVLNTSDRIDVIHRGDIARMAATLDVAEPDGVPPLWHWTSFLDRSRTSSLGPDGHPRERGLTPDPPYPRRMFAGGRMRWNAPLPIDTPIRRTASVGEVVHKEGARGPLAFVTIELTFSVDGQTLAVEEQDLVYLPDTAPSPAAVAGVPRGAEASGAPGSDGDAETAPDLFAEATFHETTLFRFSAMTFNTHRIHYDLPYAREVEGHPGLVVQGPLLAMRLLDVVRGANGDDAIERVAFRAVSPATCGTTVAFSGRRTCQAITLDARDGTRILMKAEATLWPGNR